MIRNIFIAVILFFVCVSNLSAQQATEISARKLSNEVMEIHFKTNDPRLLRVYQFDETITSLIVHISTTDSFNKGMLIVGHNTFNLREDVHYEGEGRNSIQIIFDQPVSSIKLFLPEVETPYRVFGITAPELEQSHRKHMLQSPSTEGCEEPLLVDQDEWREGLPAPSYSRSFTETEHLIVHHSATSNSLTDYYNVVRNIYLYHTQVNGWSDIGYNYLVAADGTIFKGRDPGQGEQDYVLGAHFCGRNSTTMGVCVLGDYSVVEPTPASLEALETLLTWKAFKDDLDVSAEKNHPLNPALPVIAGHRQGCATECPGSELFARLDDIRQAVATGIEMCSDPLVADKITLYPNPSRENLQIEIPEGTELDHLSVINLSGQLQNLNYWDEGNYGYKALVSHLKPGVYIFRIKLKNMDPQFKKVILL